MADQTSFLQLVQPLGGEPAEIRVINENMDKIDEWAGTIGNPAVRVRAYRGATNDRATIVPNPVQGDTYLETDSLKRTWRHDGVNWLTNNGFGILISPTTVTGGTAQPDGSVTFSGVAAVSLDGVFTSRFREYEIRYRVNSKPTNAGISIRLRAGGVDNTTAGVYFLRRTGSSGSGFIENPATLDRFDPDFNPYVNIAKSLHLLAPQESAFTNVWSAGGIESNNAGLMTTCIAASGQHQVASAFDGITLYTGANMAGSLVVIGYP